jgi:hypothetical protein
MPGGAATIDLSAFMSTTLPLQVDACSLQQSPMVRDQLGRVGTTLRCRGEGFLSTTDQPSMAAAIAALASATSYSGIPFILNGLGGGQLYSIYPAACLEGGPHIGFELLDDDKSNATYQRVRFTVEAKTPAGANYNSFLLRTHTGPDGLQRVSQTGVLVGSNVQATFTGVVLPAWRQSYPAASWVTDYEVEYPYGGNAIATQLTSNYSLTAQQLAGELPGGATVVEGEMTTRIERDEQQRLTSVYDYDLLLSGGDYSAIVTSLRPDPGQNQIIRESSSFSSVKQLRLRCSFSVLASADQGSSLLDWTQTLSVTQDDDSYEIVSYPGAAPIVVQRPQTLPRVSQTGSATGLGVFIREPDAVLDDYEHPPQLGYVDVSNYEKKTTWNYQMVQTDGTDLDIGSLLGQIARPMDPDTYSGDDDEDGD